ncbi:MAG: capsid protein [Burkholderiaceae bacterium]|nr:capsid protein [Burkholderiaceae bacterium]
MDTIKQLIEKQGQDWHEYRKTNDERLSKLEKGQGTAELEAKLEKMDEALSKQSELIKELETKGNRPGTTGEDSEYKAGFLQFVRKGDASGIETKAVNTTADADGGYAIPEEIDRNIIQLLRKETPMRLLASSMTVGTEDYKKLINIGGATTGWVDEDDARTGTDNPKLAQVAPFFGEIYANPAATQKSLDDVFFDVEAWINSEVVQAFTEAENAAFTSGNGTKKPKGFLAYTTAATADSARALGTLQHVISGAATAITADGLLDLIYSLKSGYRRNASFTMNGLTVAAARKLKDEQKNYLWQPGLQNGEPDRLCGYGVVENDDMPDVAADALALAFGDFKRGYLIVDRIGVRMLRDPYTNKPYVQFYTTKRVGGGVMDSNAIKIQKIAAA